MTSHLVTGGTGYIGRKLVKALLDNGDLVTVIIRGDRRPALDRAARIFPDLLARHVGRFRVATGDVTRAGLALAPGLVETLAESRDLQVWHLAANLSFKDSDRLAVMHTNVDGTRNVVQFANSHAARLLHVSTAFVCGDSRGTFGEEDLDVGQRFRNGYEESKYLAERVVREEAGVPFVIFRPSVVVGDNAYDPVSGGNVLGYYRFAYLFCLLKRRLSQAVQSGSPITRLALRALGTRYDSARDELHVPWLRLSYPEPGTVDVVHVDEVVRAMVGIGASDIRSGSTFHLTQPDPQTFGFLLRTMLDDLGILDVRYAALPPRVFRAVFKAVRYVPTPYRAHLRAVLNYLPYINQDLRFVTANAAACGAPYPGTITREGLREINREAAEAMFRGIDRKSRLRRRTARQPDVRPSSRQQRWSET